MPDQPDLTNMTDEQLHGLMQDGAMDEAPPEPEAVAAEEPPETPETPPEAPEEKHKPSVLDDLKEERARRKEAVARQEEMERRFQEFQARTMEYMKAMQTAQQPGQPPQPEVDFQEDPIEYLRRQQESVSQNLEALRSQQAEIEQRRQQQEQWSAMTRGVQAAEQAFVEKTPDYYEAVNWARSQYKAQLAERGVPPSQIDQAVLQHTIALVQQAASVGMDPATWAYTFAKNMGYQPKPVAAVPPPGEAPRSLGSASGRQDTAELSLSDLSRMSNKDFEEFFQKKMAGS